MQSIPADPECEQTDYYNDDCDSGCELTDHYEDALSDMEQPLSPPHREGHTEMHDIVSTRIYPKCNDQLKRKRTSGLWRCYAKSNIAKNRLASKCSRTRRCTSSVSTSDCESCCCDDSFSRRRSRALTIRQMSES